MTLVSFVIPSYNRSKHLKIGLQEIEKLNYDFPYEIIVIDNASSDDSVEMIRRDFPDAKLFPLENNFGAKSRNIGIDEAKGDMIVMLDDDSYPLPGTIEGGIKVLESEAGKDVGSIAFNILQADGTYWTNGLFPAFTGCGAMFRKRLFDEIGAYPDNYLYYTEEYDISCRIWANGQRVVNFRELECFHFKASLNRNFNNIMNRLVRNNILLWRKYLPKEIADDQVKTEVWRYRNIALKEGAMDGFESGLKEGDEVTREYMDGKNPHLMREDAALKMLGYLNIVDRIDQLASDMPGASVLLFNIGKVMHLIIRTLREIGLKIAGIIDDNAYMQKDTFEGLDVHGRDAFNSLSYDCVVIGSLSISLNDEFEKELCEMNLEKPVIRMADFDRLSDYF